MAKYNSDCKNEYAMQLMGECFRNSLKYYKKNVVDYDYFNPVLLMADTKEIEQTVYDVFGGDSLVESGVAHFTEKIGREPHNGRKYGDPEVFYANDNPLETIRDLWNDKEHQEKCRQMLIAIADRFVAEHSTPIQGDLLKERFDSLKSFFGFSDLEMDALKCAFIRKYTVFREYPFNCRFNRSGKPEKLDFFAMCIDHSVPEVRELMKEQSRLRIFDFLDEDLDFGGSVENYLNGEDDQPLHGRFYRKAKSEDVLPWDFYPVSLREHGSLLKRLEPHCELMEAKTADDVMLPAKDYSLEGLNLKGDIELGRITEAVGNYFREIDGGEDVGVDRPRMNLLLWGPPGTGKTEFVKYLAKAVNRKVIVKMGSDLLSMWVGGTEKNIKAAFDEAESENAILFLDEIDGIVQDRSGAQRSWEVTQVNELLHRMENFKGVMVAATNFMDNLDAAIMRRFTFKLHFDYLEEDGKRIFFERMFNTSLAETEAKRLAVIPNLAPGDFRTVRQSLYYLGGAVTNATRLNGLEKESFLKKNASVRIGF